MGIRRPPPVHDHRRLKPGDGTRGPPVFRSFHPDNNDAGCIDTQRSGGRGTGLRHFAPVDGHSFSPARRAEEMETGASLL